MPPAIIADSDDDSDGAQSPALTPGGPIDDGLLLPTRSSDRVSLATNSTDPAFFQGIYNEHKAAADQQALNFGADGGLEPADAAGQEAPPSRTGARDDPWDIPSSPEAKIAKKVKPLAAKRTTSVKVTRGLRKNLERLGYESVSDDNHDEPVQERRKRRKVGGTRRSQKDSNDVSLVELPLDGELQSVASQSNSTEVASNGGMGPPTDIASTPLLVAPKQLSASQKLEYQSMEAPSSSPPMRAMELRNPAVGSSGTATNVNTQRSHMMSSYDAGLTVRTPEHEMIRATRRASPTPRQRRNSSPDVITSMPPPTQTPKPNATRVKQVGTSTAEAARESHSAGDDDEVWVASKVEEDEASDYAAPEKQAKPKRQRGRPKKGGEDKSDVTSTAAAQESAAKPKRKRGRPKKSETVAKDDQGSSVTHDTSHRQAATDEKLGHVAEGYHTAEGDVDKEPSLPTSTTKPPQKSPGKAEIPGGLEETPADPVEACVPESAGQQTPVREERKLQKNGDLQNRQSASKLDSAGKPVYRVGLSKRLRIAPLLKSLRK